MDAVAILVIIYGCLFLPAYLLGPRIVRLVRRRWKFGGAELVSLPEATAQQDSRCAPCNRHRNPGGTAAIISICCNCKNVRDENEEWQQVEAYFTRACGIEFSHDVCPECGKKLYPWFQKDKAM